MSVQTYGNPAQSLLGMKLKDGWNVIELVKKKPEDTGGHFSVCYIVEKNGTKAFLKALDLTAAFHDPDFLTRIRNLTDSFLFERDLLYNCKDNKLRKIVTPITDGDYLEPGQPPFMKVYYIIFEMADGTLRNQLASMKKFDLAWLLRSLHHTAIGLKQLHQAGIAHQDLKPSNVLLYPKGSKIGDLGRSSHKGIPSMNDKLVVAGDRTYAPIDLFYNRVSPSEFSDRFSSDLYHLGSLVFFYFFKVNLSQRIWFYMKRDNLDKNLTTTDFSSDLPYYQQAFKNAIVELEKEINKYSEKLAKDLIPLVNMLCDPDPANRGHKRSIDEGHNQYRLERFVSKFDSLAKRAELGML